MNISQQIKPKVDTYDINQIKVAKDYKEIDNKILSTKSTLNLCLDIDADLSYKKIEYIDGANDELLKLYANLTTWLMPTQDRIFLYVPQVDMVYKKGNSLTIY